MEINQVDKEVGSLIARKGVYGIETLINAIMREAIGRPYIDREFIHRMVDRAMDRAIQDRVDLIIDIAIRDKEDFINGKD